MAEYRFVGRARWTGRKRDGRVRERQVQFPDGRTEWAEEGSLNWDLAAREARADEVPYSEEAERPRRGRRGERR